MLKYQNDLLKFAWFQLEKVFAKMEFIIFMYNHLPKNSEGGM